MSATSQRLMLSFIYVHRENVPLSALKEFIDVLPTAISILPTSRWISMLLDLLMIFCSERMKVHLYEKNSREIFDMGITCEVQSDNSLVCYENAVIPKQTTDYASSDFSSLKGIVQRDHTGNSLQGQYGQTSCFNDQQTELEKESEVPDMNTEMSVEVIAATQQAKKDDSVHVLLHKNTGIVLFYYVV